MCSWNDADDRAAIARMNADLRHAQVGLLSAQCATDRLRQNFSIEDLARHGEKKLLRKAIDAADGLNELFGRRRRFTFPRCSF